MTAQLTFKGIHLAGTESGSLWDITCEGGVISDIQGHGRRSGESIDGRILAPSLCHPHIHLDKCFLLSHPSFAHLSVEVGDFAEALEITNIAKSAFTHEDLMERGSALIEESINFGVTHMRAFVEVDNVVDMKCLDAGLALKKKFHDRCHIQICAFAQDAIFSKFDDHGKYMCDLMEAAASKPGVEVLGSTPYVEKSEEDELRNIEWVTELAMRHQKLLDFHLDYNLDKDNIPRVHHVIETAKRLSRSESAFSPSLRRITLGHCTRLTLFDSADWQNLRDSIADLPISFVGLPTSDLFMMARPDDKEGGGKRYRGSLQVPQMIRKYELNAAIGVNNVGNAFTPQGSCDPLSIACLGVGLYHAGTRQDADTLYECVSHRAKQVIGVTCNHGMPLQIGDAADFIAFGKAGNGQDRSFREPQTVADLVYDATRDRKTYLGGRLVSLC